MRNVIYLDVLLFLNAFVTAALLLATSAMLKIELRRRWLLLGTALGAALSLVVFLPPLPLALSILIKISGCALLTLAAFGFRSWRIYLRAAAAFLTANFIFAGAMLALWSFLAPRGMIFNNGTAYWDISVLLLCLSTIFCYAVVRLTSFLTRRNAPDNHVFELTIEANSRKAECRALFDSGSALREGFSGAPVIVVQADALGGLVSNAVGEYLNPDRRGDRPRSPAEEQNAFSKLTAGDSILTAGDRGRSPLQAESQSFRLIPYNSVGGTGVLPAFRAERAMLRQGRKQWVCDEAYIAVSEKTLARGEYSALIGSVFFENCREGKV